MLRFRSIGRAVSFGVVLAACSCLVVGCGDSAGDGKNRTVYTGPEEVNQKNKDLKEAMQGGAYGSAGKKAAGLVGGAGN